MRTRGRLSLKRRILIALAAIAAVHAAFYAAPRWWYTRPRVYPEAYARAVEILKQEFGAAAVEKGIVSIPNVPISVPYMAEALVNWAQPVEVCIYMDKERTTILRYEGEGICEVAQVTGAIGRDLFAELMYFSMLDIDVLAEPEVLASYRSHISPVDDMTWPLMSAGRRGIDHSESWTAEESDAVFACGAAGALVERGWVAALAERSDVRFSGKREEVRPALLSLIDRHPVWSNDVRKFKEEFLRLAGREDLPLLKHLYRKTQSKLDERVREVPFIGRWLSDKIRTRGLFCEDKIWELEELDGRTREEQFMALLTVQSAGAGGSAVVSDRARALIGNDYRAEYVRFAASHYDRLTISQKADAFRGTGSAVDDEEGLLKRGITDASAYVRILARARYYDLTKDMTHVKTIEEMAESATVGFEDVMCAMETLFDLYGRDKSAGDIPGFARQFIAGLASVTGLGEYDTFTLAQYVLPEILKTPGREADELVRQLFLEPERLFPSGMAAEDIYSLRYSVLYELGGQCAGIVTEYLGRLSLPEDKRDALDAVRFLGSAGDARALPVLEPMLQREELQADSDPEAKNISRSDNLSCVLRDAVTQIRLMNSDDPVAFLRTLSADDAQRPDYAAKFSREELQALLADDTLMRARGSIISALTAKRNSSDHREPE